MPSEIPSRTWPWVAIVVAGAAAIVMAMASPADVVQGNLVRILYLHVPAIVTAYVAFAVTLVASIGYLIRKDLRWDRVAAASAEIGVVLVAVNLVTGMIWGKPTWGVWWTWDDPRLVLSAILFFVYLGYLSLRRTTDDPQLRAGRAAVLGILGVVMIPLVHFSVVWWRTLHQGATVLRPDGSTVLDPMMRLALITAFVAFAVIYAALMTKRIELHRLNDRIAEQTASLPVAGASVTAPDLPGTADV